MRSFRWSGYICLFTARDMPLFCMFFNVTALVTWRPDGFTCSVTGSMLSILAAERRSLTVCWSRAGKTAGEGRWSAVVTCDGPLLSVKAPAISPLLIASAVVTCDGPLLSGVGRSGRAWRSLAIGGEKALLLGGAPAGCGRTVLLGGGM